MTDEANVLRSLLGKKRKKWLVVFESRAEVWRGAEDALRDQRAKRIAAMNAGAKPTQSKRVNAYVPLPLIREALRPDPERAQPGDANDQIDVITRLIADGLRVMHARADARAIRQVAVRVALKEAIAVREALAHDVHRMEKMQPPPRGLWRKRREYREARNLERELWSEQNALKPFVRDATGGEYAILGDIWRGLPAATLDRMCKEQRDQAIVLNTRLVLEGYALDESLWAKNYGIDDDECGCPDEERRDVHKLFIRSGIVNLRLCEHCPRYGKQASPRCVYRYDTMLSPGVIASYGSRTVFETGLTVLFGPVPASNHAMHRSESATLVALANLQLGAVASTCLSDLLDGKSVLATDIAAHLRDARAMHQSAARMEGELRQKLASASTTQERDEADRRVHEAQTYRRQCCSIVTILEAGAYYATAGRTIPPGDSIQRPVVVASAGGIFAAFTDNVEQWRDHFEALGYEIIQWLDAARRMEPLPRKPDIIEELVDAAAEIIRTTGAEPAGGDVATHLSVRPRLVVERCSNRGVMWDEVIALAHDKLDGAT